MAYKDFAYVYDRLMSEAPYDKWVEWIQSVVRKDEWVNPRIVELGCGTGNILIPLTSNGWNVIGIDLSEDMLTIAQDKANETGLYIHLLHQDMREFELGHPVDLIYSFCDSLNYLLQEEDIQKTFQLVYESLNVGGLWVFDYHTEHMITNVLGNQTFTERNEDVSYIWDSSFDMSNYTVQYDISFFVQEREDRYKRFEEVHFQRAFPIETIQNCLIKAGFVIEGIYGDFTREAPHVETERLFIEARKR